MCSTGHVRNGILFIGRGLAYRKTEETDLLRSKWGPVDWEGCGVPQNEGNRLVLERYNRDGGPVHQEGCGIPQNGTPQDTVHLHRRPPPASTGYRRPPPASTSSCSSSLHRALLHRLLFNHPSTGTPPPSTVHPALHTTGSCSSRGNATAHCSSNPPLQRSLFIPEAASIGFS